MVDAISPAKEEVKELEKAREDTNHGTTLFFNTKGLPEALKAEKYERAMKEVNKRLLKNKHVVFLTIRAFILAK